MIDDDWVLSFFRVGRQVYNSLAVYMTIDNRSGSELRESLLTAVCDW
jgi:hypothetical protein